MIVADNFKVFQLAASAGHLAVLNHLEKIAPDKLRDMIEARSFFALRLVAVNNRVPVVTKVSKKTTMTLKQLLFGGQTASFSSSSWPSFTENSYRRYYQNRTQ